jgi:predicted nuclease of predicted toxin-antitoxin system
VKLTLDEGLPQALHSDLAELGHEVHTVRLRGLSGRSDAEVWKDVQAEGHFFVTLAPYFYDLDLHPPGTHYGVLRLRLPQFGRRAVHKRMMALMADQQVQDWAGCNVLGEAGAVYVRKAASQ